MKKKQLEMFLQQLPTFPQPQPSLEQYITPAALAADVLFFAYQYHDIQEKSVVDLGCGTGIFAFGSSLLGAKNVIGIDKDSESITLAKKFAREHDFDVTFQVQDIIESKFSADTVIMNPPFGAQKQNIHADQLFLQKAINHASVVYSLHLTKTIPYLETFIKNLDGCINDRIELSFPIKAQFVFHKKRVEYIPVSCLRIIRPSAED